MCGMFAGLLRARRALAPRAGVMTQQRAGYMNSRPPKDNVGLTESAMVLTGMFVAFLGPSCWVLSNLDHYKGRD